ncbi:MAG: DUF3979 family protein [Bacilli bacterium]
MHICIAECFDSHVFTTYMNDAGRALIVFQETSGNTTMTIAPYERNFDVSGMEKAVIVTVEEDGFCGFRLFFQGILVSTIESISIDRIVSDGEEVLFRFERMNARCVNVPLTAPLTLNVTPYWEVCADCDEDDAWEEE